MSRHSIEAAHTAVREWNAKHPVRQPVMLNRDFKGPIPTRTRGEAYVAASGHAVIHLDGIRGYYLLDRCSPMTEASFEAADIKLQESWIRPSASTVQESVA